MYDLPASNLSGKQFSKIILSINDLSSDQLKFNNNLCCSSCHSSMVGFCFWSSVRRIMFCSRNSLSSRISVMINLRLWLTMRRDNVWNRYIFCGKEGPNTSILNSVLDSPLVHIQVSNGNCIIHNFDPKARRLAAETLSSPCHFYNDTVNKKHMTVKRSISPPAHYDSHELSYGLLAGHF